MLLSAAKSLILRSGVCILLSLTLAGCFQPLYGAIDPDIDIAGTSAVYVETINGQTGQILQTELQFLMKAVRDVQNRKLSLSVTPASSEQSFFVDIDRDRSKLAAVVIEARYFLREVGNPDPISAGIARASAAYENDGQILNRESAVQDAGERAAKSAARIIADRVAFALKLQDQPIRGTEPRP